MLTLPARIDLISVPVRTRPASTVSSIVNSCRAFRFSATVCSGISNSSERGMGSDRIADHRERSERLHSSPMADAGKPPGTTGAPERRGGKEVPAGNAVSVVQPRQPLHPVTSRALARAFPFR
jgi:hypothetical protein